MPDHFTSLMIEPTNFCNLHCPICPTGGVFDKRPKGVMNFKQFKRIIDPLKNSLQFILLWGYGEPFLASDIMEMLDCVGEMGIKTLIHTNGNILSKEKLVRFKSNYKIDITFSIDGITQQSYEYYRRGGSLKKALKNLSYLVNLKRKFNLFNLEIIWQFLINRYNEHEVYQVWQLAKKIGVDRLRLKTISIKKDDSLYNEFIPQNKKYQRLTNKLVNFENCDFVNPGRPFIFWNGDVVACCQDFKGRSLMGNALRENLLDIWNSKKYKKFRNDYKKEVNIFCNSHQTCHLGKNSKVWVADFHF